MRPHPPSPSAPFPLPATDAAAALVAEVRRLRHLMRELAAAGVDLREDPGLAFPIVKVAEADRMVLGLLVQSRGDPETTGFADIVPDLVEIAADKRRRLVARLPRPVRERLLRGLESPPPAEEEVWSEAADLRRRRATYRLGRWALPLSNDRARALARALRDRARVPATWADLWGWA